MMRGRKNPMHGRKIERTEEQRKLASERMAGEKNPFYGKKHSDETKEKMRSGNKKQKAVTCIETCIRYRSACEAERQTGIYNGSIAKCCKGVQKTSGGYHWQYAA